MLSDTTKVSKLICELGEISTRAFRALMPDPFVLAVLLTWVAFLLAFVIEGMPPAEILREWQGDDGFWGLLGFTTQMILILVTGHSIAAARAVRAILTRIARVPRTARQATAAIALAAMMAALANWGLGLIVGAILAREVGKSLTHRQIAHHYPLLCAAGYTGLLCWHGGLSGSAPLKVTSQKDIVEFLGAEAAATVPAIPFTATVLSTTNLLVTGGLLVIVPSLCAAMTPKSTASQRPFNLYAPKSSDEGAVPTAAATRIQRLEQSPWLMACLALPMCGALLLWWRDVGISKLDPNRLNLMFLVAGLVLHQNLRSYKRSIHQASHHASGIILQFPFYAGIMGIFRASGLVTTFTNGFIRTVPRHAFLAATIASAGVLNIFVPSGGGQWAIQGPLALKAAQSMNVPANLAVLAVAYGDQLTNMLQPFWALPLLSLTGVQAREIVGYTAVLMVFAGLWCASVLTITTP